MRLLTDLILKDAVEKGGPGSGPHPGSGGEKHKATGMTHQEFGAFASKVGNARNATRTQEDKHRNAGEHDKANELYQQSKDNAKAIMDAHNVSPKAFDAHMKDYARAAGVRPPNVKMVNVYGGR